MAPNKRVAPLRRDQIVQATIQCLARDGYARLTMKALAQEAGVSQGILHYYFADKAAILAAVLETVTADLNQRLEQAQQAHLQAPEKRLRAVIRTCLETAQACPELWHSMLKFSVLDVASFCGVAVSSDPAPDSAIAPSFFGRSFGQLPYPHCTMS